MKLGSAWPVFLVVVLVAAAVAGLLLFCPACQEPPPAPQLSDCRYQPIDPMVHGNRPLQAAAEYRSKNGVLEATLVVDYADNRIAGCDVHLRSYNGALVGPTFRVKPGDVLRVRLDNRLPVMPRHSPGHAGMHDHNTPHGFNTTNLHTHGLWVSPAGNSDNVTLRIEPRTSFDFEIRIPKEHPTGTFWYHAHVHGSTALQVSSGMAGAIIIEGGLDTVDKIAKAREQILLFQQIVYDDKGELENYQNFGPRDWGRLQRRTTVNGQTAPRIDMWPGEVQRWRMIHGGVRETLNISFILPPAGAALNDVEGAVGSWAVSSAGDLHEIAVDGLALGRIDAWDKVPLYPGYRSDVLVKAPAKAGIYLLVDLATESAESLHGADEAGRVLAFVHVAGGPKNMPLPSSAEVAGFLPHQPIADSELDGRPQEVRFRIERRICDAQGVCRQTCEEGEEGCATRFMVNDRPFSDTHDRVLTLGTAAQWTVKTGAEAGHPFHIHVNPFQVERRGPDGKMQTVWRDTLFVGAGDTQTFRTRYQRFIGTFVLHCHILDHEDQGMMELVTIASPPS